MEPVRGKGDAVLGTSTAGARLATLLTCVYGEPNGLKLKRHGTETFCALCTHDVEDLRAMQVGGGCQGLGLQLM